MFDTTGTIEEIIFRGFLFKMMEKDNVKRAMFVSAITFGIGHIVNLLNGAEVIPTMLQICYAVSIGYLFVVIFYRSKSLIPCIITHIVINASSVIAVDNKMMSYITSAFLIIVPMVYTVDKLKPIEPEISIFAWWEISMLKEVLKGLPRLRGFKKSDFN